MASDHDLSTTPDELPLDVPVKAPRRRRAAKSATPVMTDTVDAPSAPVEAPSDGDETVRPARKRATKAAKTAVATSDKPAKKPAKKATKKAKAAAEDQDAAVDLQGDAADTAAVPSDGMPVVAAPRKRTRKKVEPAPVPEPAVEPEDELEEAAEVDGQSDTVEEAPAAPSFGLIFQPPQPVTTRRRRATAPVQAPSERVDEVVDTAGPTDDHVDAPTSDKLGDTDDNAPEPEADDTDGTSRSRRRRGGRGRRSRSTGESGRSTDGAVAEEGEDDSAPEPVEDTEAGESATRRRRRRRRSGGAGDSEDPPGTVTRVREPRSTRDEPTAVKGSTRLEAKKQRRREGREAGRRRTIITEAEFLARRESVERVMVVRGRGDKTQIGVLEDGVLVEHYVSRETTVSMAGNVYLGRVQNVLPSMEAAFVDIGKGRNAVLYAGEVNWDAAGLEVNQAKRIENALSSGDTVLVQVTKDPIGHKGARLTSQISLPGRYLVYVPEGSMTGISRKLPDTERARLKAILKEVVPDSAGGIVRTAAEGASEEELRADVERLTKAWDAIKAKAEAASAKKSGSGGAPMLLHGEPDLTVRVIRDVFTEDFTSLVVAGDKAWSEVSGYVEGVAPDLAQRVTRWTSETDVFAAHRIDEQIAKAMDRKVWLPSGGSLVIDRTEAMTVVDVNTGKFIGSGGNLEETVTKNNIEAAEEIVRQLRLRDIGGIIVIDFIDMVLEANRDLVVRRLLECLGRDRTKHQVAEVTSLGLVQMTRKRVGSGLIEVFSEQCEHCAGRGIVIHTEPIDRSGGSDQGAPPQGTARSARSRRGTAATPAVTPPPEPPKVSNGPTAAQIAAAAHAAAMRHTGPEAPADDEGDPEVGGETSALVELVQAVEAVEALESEVVEAVQGKVVAAVEAEVVEAVETVDRILDLVAEVADDAPAPRARRRRGRVVAPAGPPRAASADDQG